MAIVVIHKIIITWHTWCHVVMPRHSHLTSALAALSPQSTLVLYQKSSWRRVWVWLEQRASRKTQAMRMRLLRKYIAAAYFNNCDE